MDEVEREVGDLAIGHRAAVGVHVLAEERHFLHARCGERARFREHVVEGPRHLLAARIRHDAEGAVLAAAFHDGDEGRGAIHARRRKVVELLDLRERDVDLGMAGRAAACEELGQAMQRLRAEDDVHVRRAANDRFALLARHASAHADENAGTRALERLHAPEVGEDLLLRLLAHGARVEQDEVGLGGIGGLLVTLGGGEHVGHLVRVVLVHLASERPDEDLLRWRHAFLVAELNPGRVEVRPEILPRFARL